jgi:hypothetical protein
MGCLILATQVLREHFLWHNYRKMTAIYCPNAILEFRKESTVYKLGMHVFEIWVPRLNDVSSKGYHIF